MFRGSQLSLASFNAAPADEAIAAMLACCASRMYVHVNTVRYRIGRIEAITGRDLSALPDRVDFFLALRKL